MTTASRFDADEGLPGLDDFLLEFHRALEEGRPLPDPPEELRDRLDEAGLERLEALMRELRDWDAVERRIGKGAATQPATAPARGRFRRLKRLAHGGMGIVYLAVDRRLGHQVALKIIRGRDLEQPGGTERFFAEARVAGALRHPAIVPVYDVGRTPDGRPCFAMMRVPGKTLRKRLLARATNLDGLSDWLTVFEQVARAVAHAHDHGKGIVHRDLKSKNVMVGKDLQVWVIDWGLAKRLGGDAAAEPGRNGAEGGSPGKAGLTTWGSVLGTSHSMAPEQARTDRGPVGKPADVFALGSILCEILTRAPAYTGATPEEVHARAVAADLAETHERLRASGQDPELVALAVWCLQGAQADRPQDAGAVARAVAAYRQTLQDRVLKARHQRNLLRYALAAALVLAATAATTAVQARRAARAERRFAEAAPVQDQTIRALSRVVSDPRLAELGLIALQADALGQALPPLLNYRRLVGGAESDKLLSQALVKTADVYQTKGNSEKALEALATAERYFAAVAGAGGANPDPEAVYGLAMTRGSRGVVLGKMRDRPDESLPLFRQAAGGFAALLAAGWGNPAELRMRLALCCNNEANCLRLADPAAAVTAYRQAVEQFRALAHATPPNPGAGVWLVKTASNLAIELETAGRWAEAGPVHDEAVRWGREFVARVAAERAAVADPSGNTWLRAGLAFREAFGVALFNRGAYLGQLGRTGDAEPLLREALAVYQGLAGQAPDNREFVVCVAMTRSELGRVLTQAGRPRWDEAADLLKRARDWYASADDSKDAEFTLYRGEDLLRAADLEARRLGADGRDTVKAVGLAGQALALLGAAGGGPAPRLALAEVQTLLGDLHARGGDHGAAAKAWESARSGLSALAGSGPRVARIAPTLARAEARLAADAVRRGDPAEAASLRASARRRLADARATGSDDPALADVERELTPTRP